MGEGRGRRGGGGLRGTEGREVLEEVSIFIIS